MKGLRSLQAVAVRLAYLLRPILSAAEQRVYSNVGRDSSGIPVFIVGAPRTGSTALYQAVTDSTSCLYIDNLAYCFHRNIGLGVWLSRKFMGREGHNSFSSLYGNTHTLHAPSECGALWRGWLETGCSLDGYGEVHPKLQLIRDSVEQIIKKYDENFIFKYLTLGSVIPQLDRAFPNSKFLYIRRSPLHTVHSLFLARRQAGVPDEDWWSVRPTGYQSYVDQPIVSKLVGQVYLTELELTEVLRKLRRERVMDVNYVDIYRRMPEILEFVGGDVRRPVRLRSEAFHNRDLDGDKLASEIAQCMKKHDWKRVGYDAL